MLTHKYKQQGIKLSTSCPVSGNSCAYCFEKKMELREEFAEGKRMEFGGGGGCVDTISM
jgi:hypothetical protein